MIDKLVSGEPGPLQAHPKLARVIASWHGDRS